MFKELQRPYKETKTADTLSTIKKILDSLELKITPPIEGNPYQELYWCSVRLDKSQGGFSANGKGRTYEYAKTSAYAEFMERLQNGLNMNFSWPLLQILKNEAGYYYFPDEKLITREDFLNLPEEIIRDIIPYKFKQNQTEFIAGYFKALEKKGLEGTVSVPFYDTKHERIVNIPLNYLILAVGSNGMCAGNTRDEGVFQGLCELIERWNASRVYYEQLTPPTIPEAYLKTYEAEYALLEEIRSKTGLKVIIKDFSVHKDFTSVGLLALDEKAGLYTLNVGSETSFQVALSRSITEVYQGLYDLRSKMLPIPREQHPWFLKEDADSQLQRDREFAKFIIDGRGVFPPSLFAETPSYEFHPDKFQPRGSYQDEVKRIIGNFHALGHNVYIRDVSFLGFPSYFVYIPHLSSVGKKISFKNSPGFYQINLDDITKLFFRFTACSKEELLKLAQGLEQFNKETVLAHLFYLEFDQESEWGQMETAFFLTLLYYRLGDNRKAYQNFTAFLSLRKEIAPYYQGIALYLKLLCENVPLPGIAESLKQAGLEEETISEIMADMSVPEDIFKNFVFPACPDCGTCALQADCITGRKFKTQKPIHQAMKNHRVRQM